MNCLANAYRRLCIVYKNSSEPDSAIIYGIRSATIADSMKYYLSAASSYNQLATIYVYTKNNRKALLYFQEALNDYIQIPHYRGMSDATFNIAEVQFELGEIDSANLSCDRSLHFMRQSKDTSTVGYNYDLLSKIALIKNNPLQAQQFSKSAIKLLRSDKDFSGLLPALTQLGKVFTQLNQHDSALYYFKEAFALAHSANYKEDLYELSTQMASCYENLHESDSCIKYLKLSTALSDTLNNQTRLYTTNELLTKFDTEKKEAELKTERERSKQMKIQVTILSLLIITLLVILLLVLRNFRQRKKIANKESELQNANAMLRGQDAERERIARELHDRVGSMLSTVKLHFTNMEEHLGSLIKTQSKSYERALLLLDETYEEVRRISHDLDTGLLGRFGLRTAMLQLAQVIESTNQLKVQYIDNELAPELYKPFETDLYRITQELLSNTIKYAKASEVSIQISYNKENIVYSYEDDGVGFKKELLQTIQGIGFKNIGTRVKNMKGTLHLETSPGNGLNLIIEIPVYVNKSNHH